MKVYDIFTISSFTLMLVHTGLRYAEIETKRLVEIVIVNEVEKYDSCIG